MSKQILRAMSVVLLLLCVSFACSKPAEQTTVAPVEKQEASATAEPSLPTSATAAKTEAAIESQVAETPTPAAAAQPSQEASAKVVPVPTLPPDHWLVGTSTEPDMVPATVAPDAPRKLLAEHGPAYLEQIGDTRVLHLKGAHYDMGVQHGTLMKNEIIEAAALIHAVGTVASTDGFEAGIAEAWRRTSPFIPEKFKQEMKGIADATGLSLEQVQEFTIFPELFHCSGFAFWGKATADGALLHGRVLDYMRDAGLDKWALLIIQEPEGANAFVNVAYSGMLGSVTGMNVKQIGIGEMGGRGEGKWDGFPMSLLVRECLEGANTLDDAKRIMQESPRTCQYYYVISDGKADNGRGHAVGVAAEVESILFVEPNQAVPQLPRPLEDAVTLSADQRYNCLVDRVQKMYGKITPQIALDIMARGVAMKSNMHDALFKPQTLELWVAHSTIAEPACNRPYTHYDVKKLMQERPAS